MRGGEAAETGKVPTAADMPTSFVRINSPSVLTSIIVDTEDICADIDDCATTTQLQSGELSQGGGAYYPLSISNVLAALALCARFSINDSDPKREDYECRIRVM